MSDAFSSALAELVRGVVREELERAGVVRQTPPPAAMEYLDQRQAAEFLGVDVRTVRRLTAAYELTASYIGSRPRYARTELVAYMERQRRPEAER